MSSIDNLREAIDRACTAFKALEKAVRQIDFDELESLVDDVQDDLDDAEDEADALRKEKEKADYFA